MFCGHCEKDMNDENVVTCLSNEIDFPNGVKLKPVPFDGDKCRDCNVEFGGFHHPGCDNERCPKCLGQLISCGCLDEGE